MAWLFGTTMFVAAFLLFSAQPMIAKMVLPILGGTPGVWNTCMVFYQATLLAGYAYAHWGSRWVSGRRQAASHVLVVMLAWCVLSITIPPDTRPPQSAGIAPALWLFGLLVSLVGLPLLVISSTAPLLQHWFARSGHRHSADPYFLYAASNAGSLAGLACYPWLIEKAIPLTRQGRLWELGFLLLGVLVGASAWTAMGRAAESADDGPPSPDDAASPVTTWRDLARWMALAFIPSSWMLGVTTYVTTDLAAIPLLWTIPLGLYLVTYILAFARGFEAWLRLVAGAFLLLAVPLVLVLAAGFVHLFWMPLHLLGFFLGALLCHGRLAAARPAARHLTAYYLAIAAGGVLGGAFNALVAPWLFDRLAEYPLAVVLACAVLPPLAPSRRADATRARVLDVLPAVVVFALAAILVTHPREALDTVPGMLGTLAACGVGIYACVTAPRRPIRLALAAGALLTASALAPSPGGTLLHRGRDFFGVIRVLNDPEANVHRLMHGSTLHGQQSLDPARRREPSTYFARSGPIGDVFEVIQPRLSDAATARVAIVGLGAGTLACYARPGQSWTFFEIDPAVANIAEDPRFFTYLVDARAAGVDLDIELGDARLRLRESSGPRYRLIVLDAFSSDAVPVHLLTREAIALYRSRLTEDGLLAFNLSNRYLDLDPVLGRQAEDAGLVCRIRYDVGLSAEEKKAGKQGSIWAVLARSESDLGRIATDPRWQRPQDPRGTRAWTDDASELASHLILGWRRFPVATGSK